MSRAFQLPLTLETFKDAQYFKASWHAWKTDVYVNKTNKEHNQAQWELGQVLHTSPVGHHLNGIGNMQLSGLIHFHKSDDPYAIELFDEGSTVLPKLLVDMTTTSHPFLPLLQEQVPGLCCVKVLDTKDSRVHECDFQSQSDYDHFTSYEIVDPIFDTCNTNQGYFDAKNTAIGSGVVLNDSRSQVGYPNQDYKEAVDPDQKNGNTFQQDDPSKNYEKACWAIGTTTVAYLILQLVCSIHLSIWSFCITILLPKFINLRLWGATTTNVPVTICTELWDITNAIIVTIGNDLWGGTAHATAVTIGNNLWGEINKNCSIYTSF
ncbi:hypothetical protein ACA910_011647 [Epithemia clementina (nom. ined.)]